MSGIRPTARGIVVCEQIVVDADNPNRVSLLRVIHSIRPRNGSEFPLRCDLAVYVPLTECRGNGRVRIEIRDADSGAIVAGIRDRLVAFPNEPILVYGVRFLILDCVFPAPGLYLAAMHYDDSVLIETPILVRP